MNWEKFTWLLLDNADKYFFIAGPAFLLFYVLLRKKISYKKIQSKFPRWTDYGREIFFSTLSVIIFSFPPLFLLYVDSIKPHTTFYENISEYGWTYFICAFPIMVFLHDTYFYWVHRLMHHPKLFKLFHLIHHKSYNPSPWAAYAFHPLEAFVEAFIFVIFLFTIPVHTIHLMLFFIFSLVYNVYGHLGFELYPKGFNKHWFGKWLNTSIAHNMHHKYFKGNYGLYFTIWDRWMGTLHVGYDKAFDEVKTRTKLKTLKPKNMKIEALLLSLAMLLNNAGVFSQIRADVVVGVWLTSGKEPAKIQIYKSGGKYYGKIVWLQNPVDKGKPRLDINNSDKNKRNQQILGLTILTEFEFDGDDEWNKGKIYDPESGKTYSCYLSLKDNATLKVRGYIGLSMFGRTELWTKTTL